MTCCTCSYKVPGNSFCCTAFHPKPIAQCPDYELSETAIARINQYVAVPYYLIEGRKFLAVELDAIAPYLPFSL